MSRTEFQLPQMIKVLHTRLLVMYAAVSLALEKASACLASADRAGAIEVMDGDCEINALEKEIDDIALSVLVRTHAVAGDLRLVVGAMRIINDLERIGDEAVVVAERAVLAEPEECAVIRKVNAPLLTLAQECVKRAFTAFRDNNAEEAVRLCEITDEAAQREIKVMQGIIELLTEREKRLDPGTAIQSILVCRALTRICRRAVNLAEHTFFIRTGANIKHADLRGIIAERDGAPRDEGGAAPVSRWGKGDASGGRES